MRLLILVALAAFLSVTAACTGVKQPSPTMTCPPRLICDPPRATRTPVPASDEEAIRQAIRAEGEAVVQQDVDRLAGIWAINGTVTDVTPNSSKTWKGWEAILDRYVNIIFPSNPLFVEHSNVQVVITGGNAVALSDTKIGTTDLPQNDRWDLQKINGEWKITGLTFGLSSK